MPTSGRVGTLPGMTPIRDIETIENFLAGGYTTSDQEEQAAMETSLALDRLRDWVENARPFIEAHDAGWRG